MAKIRLDKLLAEKKFVETRQKAHGLILSGKVFVNGIRSEKPGTQISPDAQIEIKGEAIPYVSRGGLKLEKAIHYFDLDPTQWCCADIGASTGGFTDCLLQHGARKVFAVDVGYGQLAWKLRQDERVVVMERTNARHLKPGDIPAALDLIVIDASFISLKVLLPPLLALAAPSTIFLALIKPQFEVGRDKVGKGGVVRDKALHEQVVEEISRFAASLHLHCHGVTESPILGPKGNKEFLILLDKRPADQV